MLCRQVSTVAMADVIMSVRIVASGERRSFSRTSSEEECLVMKCLPARAIKSYTSIINNPAIDSLFGGWEEWNKRRWLKRGRPWDCSIRRLVLGESNFDIYTRFNWHWGLRGGGTNENAWSQDSVSKLKINGAWVCEVTPTICLTVSAGEVRSISLLWILSSYLSQVFEPSPQGCTGRREENMSGWDNHLYMYMVCFALTVFLVVCCNTLVGILTGPLTRRSLSFARLTRSLQTIIAGGEDGGQLYITQSWQIMSIPDLDSNITHPSPMPWV